MGKQRIEERRQIKVLINQVKALEKTMNEISLNNTEIGFNYCSCNLFLRQYQSLQDEAMKYIKFPALYNQYDTTKIVNVFDLTGIEQKEIFESVLVSTRMLLAALEGMEHFVDDEIENLKNYISKRFRLMFKESPKNEYEVQEKLENLFIANNMDKGLDYDRETGKFKFSGKEYIPDFIIPKYELCIEVKFIKDISRKSKIIEEINADITAYNKEYKNILFIIYDVGIIRDETEIKRDIDNIDGVNILVIKH